MTIYRGPGGTGEAHTDNDVTEVRIVAAEAEGYRDEAALSAASALDSKNAAAFSADAATASALLAEQAVVDITDDVLAADASAAAALASEQAAAASEAAALVSEQAAAVSETNAAISETNAATSEANALTSETAAATSEANAATSESNAATSETNAAASAAAALTSENNAATSETNAAASESAAASSASSAAASWDEFDDRYLGAKASDPTVDNDGNALLTGALYWNTTTDEIKIWNGTGWAFFSGLPAQAGNSGKFLSTNGSVPAWATVPDPQPATPTDDGLVFGATPDTPVAVSEGWTHEETYVQFLGTIRGGAYAYGSWNGFVDSTVDIGDPIYMKVGTGAELYYGVVTSIGTNSSPGSEQRYFVVDNPEGHPSFNTYLTGITVYFRSPAFNEGGNVSLGYTSNSSNGNSNTAIGYGAGSTITTGSNLTVLGYEAEPSSATATNEATLGNSSVTKTRLFGSLALGGSAEGTSGQVLTSSGANTTPTWSSISLTETDPVYTASSWYTTTNNSGNWNTAYGWGNHASAGYATYPSQTGNSGKYLTTNGTVTSWAAVDALPDQTGNAGEYLTTNGTVASWTALNTDANTTTKGLYENNSVISANYTITAGNNAMSAGPITINSGVTVTVPSGSRWTVV